MKENEKNEAIAEQDQLREELKALQDKQASTADSTEKPKD